MLYFIATPIGNLKDISFRAVEKLKEVDVIACEDTRKSLILLNRYEIKKRLITYHKDNEKNSADGIIKLLEEGKEVAVISDSGMPVISDPGNYLTKKLHEKNIEYSVIPGANAGLCALILSGLDARRFSFIGFLPEKNKEINILLEEIKTYENTLIFYISPHNLEKDIKKIYEVLGDRNASLVSEITKMFEKTINFKLSEFEEMQIEARGEFVLVVEGAEKKQNKLTKLSLEEQIDFYIESGMSKKEALKKVAKDNQIKNIYKMI